MPGTERRIRSRRASRSSAPLPTVSPLPGLTPRNPPHAALPMEPETRNGLSLACDDCGFHRLHPGVNGPGLLLRPLTGCFLGPFGLSAPQPRPVRPAPGWLIASDPLPSPHPARLAALPASTPLRDSYLPPDQSVRQDLPPAGSPSGPPDLRSLPAARAISRSWLRIIVPGPLRPGGLLFLKPLGTFPNMRRSTFFVKCYFAHRHTFPQVLFLCFLIDYKQLP